MPLASTQSVLPLLVCPRCSGGLSWGPGLSSACAACGHDYPGIAAAGKPVLIDSDSSIVDVRRVLSTSGDSPVERHRGRGLLAAARERLTPDNHTAAAVGHRLAADLKAAAPQGGRPTVLIVGGGEIGNGLQALYEDPDLDLISFDIYDDPNVQFLADGHQIPLADGAVDGVVVQAVLEHVLEPQRVVAEIHRVLRRDGLVYADTPFLQGVHEGPFDFTRFTESGHRFLFRRFERLDSGVVSGLGSQLLWSIRLFARGLGGPALASVASGVFCWLPHLDRRLRSGASVDGACAVYFYGRRSEREISPRDMIEHYQGAQS